MPFRAIQTAETKWTSTILSCFAKFSCRVFHNQTGKELGDVSLKTLHLLRLRFEITCNSLRIDVSQVSRDDVCLRSWPTIRIPTTIPTWRRSDALLWILLDFMAWVSDFWGAIQQRIMQQYAVPVNVQGFGLSILHLTFAKANQRQIASKCSHCLPSLLFVGVFMISIVAVAKSLSSSSSSKETSSRHYWPWSHNACDRSEWTTRTIHTLWISSPTSTNQIALPEAQTTCGSSLGSDRLFE